MQRTKSWPRWSGELRRSGSAYEDSYPANSWVPNRTDHFGADGSPELSYWNEIRPICWALRSKLPIAQQQTSEFRKVGQTFEKSKIERKFEKSKSLLRTKIHKVEKLANNSKSRKVKSQKKKSHFLTFHFLNSQSHWIPLPSVWCVHDLTSFRTACPQRQRKAVPSSWDRQLHPERQWPPIELLGWWPSKWVKMDPRPYPNPSATYAWWSWKKIHQIRWISGNK